MTTLSKHYPDIPIPIKVAFLLIYALIIGIVFGGIMGMLMQVIYLIFLFPFLMGGMLGVALASMILRWRLLNTRLHMLAALLAGCFLYGSLYYTQYIIFRGEVAAEIRPLSNQVDDATVAQITDAFLHSETGSSGFLGYLRYRTIQGFSIGYFYVLEAYGPPLRGPFVWISWGGEFIAIIATTLAVMQGMVRQIYCVRCGSWYDSIQIGNIDPKLAHAFIGLIEQDDLTHARSYIDTYSEVLPNIEIVVKRCPKCQNTPCFLIIEALDEDTNGRIKRKELARREVTPGQVTLLQPGDA